MKYIALLRGINVGGKSIVKMPDLQAVFNKRRFKNVSGYDHEELQYHRENYYTAGIINYPQVKDEVSLILL